MILDPHTDLSARLTRGRAYTAAAGPPDALQPDARALWDYLRQALDSPISLELLPPGAAAPPLARLGQAVPSSPEPCAESVLTVFTSGTTGPPKPARHAVASLFEHKRPGRSDERWLLAYAPFRWAGLSVLMHVLRSKASAVIPESLEPAALVAAARAQGATHLGLTPSLFRKLMLATARDALRSIRAAQVTFGGEAPTDAVLEAAKLIWPSARVSHVYALTEFGDICSVSDGLAGIPRLKLDAPRFSFSAAGELSIDGRATGDLWRLSSDRYTFAGRADEMINVGGVKISPVDIEEIVLGLDGIDEARAFAVPSALVGQLVGLEYRGRPAEDEVLRLLRTRLPKAAWPAAVTRVDSVALTDAGKTARKGARS